MTTSDPRETEHIECDCVPDLGPSHCHLCGERAGHPVPWSEAHPGDHDELIARAEHEAAYPDVHPIRADTVEELIDALRTEQSARQALQHRIDAVLALHHKSHEGVTPRDGWPHCNHDDDAWPCPTVVALTTESKEPDPKLDPEPWIGAGEIRHSCAQHLDPESGDPSYCRFEPRPEFSQNPADYRIEVPHD